MLTTFRIWLATVLIMTGMRIIPKEVRETVRGMIMYHVPGALTEAEKREVRKVAAAYKRS